MNTATLKDFRNKYFLLPEIEHLSKAWGFLINHTKKVFPEKDGKFFCPILGTPVERFSLEEIKLMKQYKPMGKKTVALFMWCYEKHFGYPIFGMPVKDAALKARNE
jgi:hypothetical protein